MTDPSMYYDRAGKPIGLEEWADHWADIRYRWVADTFVGDIWVATIWLGVDLNFNSPRLIFETSTFGSGNDELWQWSTEREARAGHRWVIRRVRNPRPLSKPGRLVSRKYHARKTRRVRR